MGGWACAPHKSGAAYVGSKPALRPIPEYVRSTSVSRPSGEGPAKLFRAKALNRLRDSLLPDGLASALSSGRRWWVAGEAPYLERIEASPTSSKTRSCTTELSHPLRFWSLTRQTRPPHESASRFRRAIWSGSPMKRNSPWSSSASRLHRLSMWVMSSSRHALCTSALHLPRPRPHGIDPEMHDPLPGEPLGCRHIDPGLSVE